MSGPLSCAHSVPYPHEGGPESPWLCNPDGSNTACSNCEPDSWAAFTCCEVDDA